MAKSPKQSTASQSPYYEYPNIVDYSLRNLRTFKELNNIIQTMCR